MYTSKGINKFLKEELGFKEEDITSALDIFEDSGAYGDDAFELMDNFAESFKVDMSSYRWYFHHKEEGFGSIGGLFFPPPNKRVEHIAVTPPILLESANKGMWAIQYPDHVLPKHRYDLYINGFIFVVVLVAIILRLIF